MYGNNEQLKWERVAEFIEEATIYNQSLQLKCNDLTSDISKRKAEVFQLKNLLSSLNNTTNCYPQID